MSWKASDSKTFSHLIPGTTILDWLISFITVYLLYKRIWRCFSHSIRTTNPKIVRINFHARLLHDTLEPFSYLRWLPFRYQTIRTYLTCVSLGPYLVSMRVNWLVKHLR